MKKLSSDQSGVANLIFLFIVISTLLAGYGLWRIYGQQQSSKADQVINVENILDTKDSTK